MNKFNIDRFITNYRKLNKHQIAAYLQLLNNAGYNIGKIRIYTYTEAKSIPHLFFILKDNNKEMPYFQMPNDFLDIAMDLLLTL